MSNELAVQWLSMSFEQEWATRVAVAAQQEPWVPFAENRVACKAEQSQEAVACTARNQEDTWVAACIRVDLAAACIQDIVVDQVA